MGRAPADVSGYVLAGGKSSRMGQDKALLELAGKPLVQRAVEKLRLVCAEVSIVGNRAELGVYAPVVRDLHEGCGPLGGVEAALLHSVKDWNLFMAVDTPFLPAGFLDAWVRRVMERSGARVALFTVDGRPQPALCLLHGEVAPFVSGAVGRGEFKLFPVLAEAGKELAARQGRELGEVFLNERRGSDVPEEDLTWAPTASERRGMHLWFANLNTPEEFAEAAAAAGVLEMD
jgi:molybdenum cofactor guanylyltransferase